MPLFRAAPRGEIREGGFSDAISGGLCRLAAQTSERKNIASAIFFSLSSYAAPRSGSLKLFRAGENGEGSAEVWA